MLYLLLKVSAIKAKKASFSGQLPVTSADIRGRNRSTSTFSTASSASACFAFHHLNPDYENGGDGSDLPMVCQSSISQPCSHHSSFSGPSGSRYLNNYFRLHVCLSFRPSAHLSVCHTSIFFQFLRCITQFHQ